MELIVAEVEPSSPVDPSSAVLLRLGSLCQNSCRMCSNVAQNEDLEISGRELHRRVEHLISHGFRNIVLSGGEPTLNPHFWPIVTRLRRAEVDWSLLTNGRAFSQPEVLDRARSWPPVRALVSLHSHLPDIMSRITGRGPEAFFETVRGIQALAGVPVPVVINCVLTRFSLGRLEDFLAFCAENFKGPCPINFTFPSLYSKGVDWEPIQLRFEDVKEPLAAARKHAGELGIQVFFQNIPPCVLQDPALPCLDRSSFGITHYLDECDGRTLYAIEWAESQMRAYGLDCAECTRIDSCTGVEQLYLERYGAGELRAFQD